MNAKYTYRTPLVVLTALLAVTLFATTRTPLAGADAAPAPATIIVVVPADAFITFDGHATTMKGTERQYATPPLKVGTKYHYEVVARWTANGKPVEKKRKVDVTGGATVRVDFVKAAAEAPKKTKPSPETVTPKATLSEAEAAQLGTEAYIYGYPLVTVEMTRRVATNVVEPKGAHAPMGQFARLREYPDASFRDVTAPNADTLYSSAFLDLAQEPYILSLPNQGDRYYLMPMLSGWTDVFQVPGTRTTGDKAQKYVITGPSWKGGPLPEGVKEYKSPTDLVWILGRTYCTGTPEDYTAVHALQDQYRLVPLSAYGKPYTPPPGKVNPKTDMKTPVRAQVNGLDAGQYFKLLAKLLKHNPPAAADAPMVAKLAKLGIVPGKPFDIDKLDPAVAKGLQGAPKAGFDKIMAHFKTAGTHENGWLFTTKAGQYGTDYLQRAFVTAIGLGANRPKDAVYPTSEKDPDGKPYSGANKYVMHFAKGQLPPVKGFWSLTMYNADYFFVPNALNRYTLSPRNDLKANADGSIDLYIQKDSPGKDKESNWLPAPPDRFILMLRMYWPQETPPSILDGSWKVPGVKRMP